jgi:hypothetical protein
LLCKTGKYNQGKWVKAILDLSVLFLTMAFQNKKLKKKVIREPCFEIHNKKCTEVSVAL